MKRIAPLAIATCALVLSFAFAAPSEARGRNGRQDRHRQSDRHRVEQRHQKRHHVDRHRKRHHVDRHRYRDHYRDHRRNDRRYERRHHRGYHRFDVPRHIQRRHFDDYRGYFDGHVWFAPHRHRHATYKFPVVIDGYRTYRRHDYCEGELFRPYGGSIGYEGRRWGVRLDF